VTRMRRTEWRLREAQVALDQMNQTLEARVSRRTAALTAANAELQAFAYSIAHDLRAPMTSLAGFSRLLEQSIREPQPHQSHYLQRIQQNVQAMSAITDGLLSMAHVNSVELTRATFDVSAASLRALAALRDGDAQRACDFKVQPGMAASGDPALLERVLKNLLSNAWKFSVRRETAFIEVGCEPADAAGMQVFFVRDRGEGFSMAHASRLFNPFQRLHLPTEFNGLGIGLAIVQRCVARHGGKVWAEAAPGQGATFFFSLPAAPQMDDASRWAPLPR